MNKVNKIGSTQYIYNIVLIFMATFMFSGCGFVGSFFGFSKPATYTKAPTLPDEPYPYKDGDPIIINGQTVTLEELYSNEKNIWRYVVLYDKKAFPNPKAIATYPFLHTIDVDKIKVAQNDLSFYPQNILSHILNLREGRGKPSENSYNLFLGKWATLGSNSGIEKYARENFPNKTEQDLAIWWMIAGSVDLDIRNAEFVKDKKDGHYYIPLRNSEIVFVEDFMEFARDLWYPYLNATNQPKLKDMKTPQETQKLYASVISFEYSPHIEEMLCGKDSNRHKCEGLIARVFGYPESYIEDENRKGLIEEYKARGYSTRSSWTRGRFISRWRGFKVRYGDVMKMASQGRLSEVAK
ncbi:hypothetical protein [Helicobacter sp. T3_23-1056]